MGKNRISTEAVLNLARVSEAVPQEDATAIDDSDESSIIIDGGSHAIELHNFGPNDAYYGGKGVTSSNGIPLFPDDRKLLSNVENTFILKFRCATGETANIRKVQYR